MKIIYFIVGFMSAVVAHSFIYDMVKHRNNRNGELIGHCFCFRKGIGECLVLLFNTEPRERPIRPHKYGEYMELLGVSE